MHHKNVQILQDIFNILQIHFKCQLEFCSNYLIFGQMSARMSSSEEKGVTTQTMIMKEFGENSIEPWGFAVPQLREFRL